MSAIYCVCPSRKIQGEKTKFEEMSRPFSKHLFLDAGFSFFIKILTKFSMMSPVDQISLRWLLFPNPAGYGTRGFTQEGGSKPGAV